MQKIAPPRISVHKNVKSVQVLLTFFDVYAIIEIERM